MKKRDNSNEIEARIEELRIIMQDLIENKNNITDPEIIDVSQKLDKLLNMYRVKKDCST